LKVFVMKSDFGIRLVMSHCVEFETQRTLVEVSNQGDGNAP
jgi:hypothetical protein